VVYHKNRRCTPEDFLGAIAPFRKDIVVGVECIFCWYWLADLCEEEGIDFVLGHALYMKAIHGVKTKNDRIDSLKIARLMRGGNFPVAYFYPPGMRATRDLMRRRIHFVRKRAELLGHPDCCRDDESVQPASVGHTVQAASLAGQRYRRTLPQSGGPAYGRD